ncbi:hypothetical protein OPQ81_010979 [Rhizoctonia solani]|nr:hypothetical protein OPQ81_010979 [Rhizoctonia solani]
MHITPGKYRIKNAMAWTTFDEATDGSHIIHGWEQTNKDNQHWLVQGAGTSRDCFTMKNLASGLYACVDGACNGSRLRGCENPTTWVLDQQPNGSVFITFPHSKYVIDLDRGLRENGTTIHLWEKHSPAEDQQLWYFERISGH